MVLMACFFCSTFHRYFRYVRDIETKREKIFVSSCEDVEKGYHSYKNLIDATSLTYKIGIFIVPKYAEIAEGINPNVTDGIVSSSLIYVGPLSLRNYLKALWKAKITQICTKKLTETL